MPSQEIKSLREQARLSQAVFAAVLNTSLSTVQKWEVGDKKTEWSVLKLLNLIERKGLEAVLNFLPAQNAVSEITSCASARQLTSAIHRRQCRFGSISPIAKD